MSSDGPAQSPVPSKSQWPAPSTVRFIPLAYTPADSDVSALRLCHALFPSWEQDPGPVTFTRFTDGITNTLLKAAKARPGSTEEEVDAEAVLIRAYGKDTEILIDREREAGAQLLLASKGLAPPLLARFRNGILYRFMRGRVCAPADLRRPPVYLGVARRLGEWHARLPVPIPPMNELARLTPDPEAATNGNHGHQANGHAENATPPAAPKRTASAAAAMAITPDKPTPNLWTVMQRWVFALPTGTPAEVERKERLQQELTRTVKEFAHRPDIGIGFNGLVTAHCDLLSGNVIRLPPNTSPSNPTTNAFSPAAAIEVITFIDYEYVAPAPAAFDLANHFAEFGGFECDFSVLPTRSTRASFLATYVASWREHRRAENPGEDCGSAKALLAALTREVDAFRGLPGLYWGIWALIQATISQIDFDYASYAEIRLGEYFAWRAEEDGSRAREGREMPLRERRWAEE